MDPDSSLVAVSSKTKGRAEELTHVPLSSPAAASSCRLPNEMLEIILSYLPTKDLLANRCVSREFKVLSSSICRRRHVKLNMKWKPALHAWKLDRLYETMEKSDDLPWSSCTLNSWRGNQRSRSWRGPEDETCENVLKPYQIKRFLQTFGKAVKQIVIGGDNSRGILRILEGVPNIEVFISFSPFVGDGYRMDVPKLPDGFQLNFQHLKRVMLDLKGEGRFKLLELLLTKNGRLLDELVLSICNMEISEETASKLSLLLTSVKSIRMDFVYCHDPASFRLMKAIEASPEPLAVIELRLGIGIGETASEELECFGQIERFLGSLSKGLKTMAIYNAVGSKKRKKFPARLTIPYLSTLTTLELNGMAIYNCGFSSLDPPTPPGEVNVPFPDFPYLSPLMTGQFPVLEVVHLIDLGQHTGIYDSCQFDTVQKLHVYTANGQTRRIPFQVTNFIFPNLTKLDCKGDVEEFRYIVSTITKLTELSYVLLAHERWEDQKDYDDRAVDNECQSSNGDANSDESGTEEGTDDGGGTHDDPFGYYFSEESDYPARDSPGESTGDTHSQDDVESESANEEEEYDFVDDSDETGADDDEEEAGPLPSLSQMTALRRLTLTFQEDNALEDFNVDDLGLLELKPLEFLELKKVKISKDYERKLGARHFQFRFSRVL